MPNKRKSRCLYFKISMILIWALLFGGITAQIVQLDDLRFSSGSTSTDVLSSNWTTTAASSNVFTRTRAPDEMAAIVPEERYAVNWTTRFDTGKIANFISSNLDLCHMILIRIFQDNLYRSIELA